MAASIRALSAVFVAAAMTACAGTPAREPVKLLVTPQSPVWPRPPETARYALVGELIGERDLISGRDRVRSGAARVFRFIIGLAIGKRRYSELRRPVAGFTAADGAVFVADVSLHGVVKFDVAHGRFAIWRDAAKHETFVTPAAVISDGTGGVYVSDAERAEIFRLDEAGEPIGRFGAGHLARPLGLARDPSDGAVFVADAGAHAVKKFSAAGKMLGVIGGPGRNAGDLNTPTHLAFHDGRLYVADTFNFRIQQFDRDGTPLAAFGEAGIVIGDMARPKGVAVGGGGRIYVVESLFDHLLIFNPGGRLLMTLTGEGASARKFFLPSGVWTDDRGRVYVADMFNGRILVYQELTALSPETEP